LFHKIWISSEGTLSVTIERGTVSVIIALQGLFHYWRQYIQYEAGATVLELRGHSFLAYLLAPAMVPISRN